MFEAKLCWAELSKTEAKRCREIQMPTDLESELGVYDTDRCQPMTREATYRQFQLD